MKYCWVLGTLAVSAVLIGEAEAASPAAVEAEPGIVVSAQHYASEVGAGILAQGGNAIDAAVAVGYALAVVDPCCGNIGGGEIARAAEIVDRPAGVVEIHRGGRGTGCGLAEIDEGVAPVLEVDGHKPAAADIAAAGVDDGERKADCDRGIDRIAAGP